MNMCLWACAPSRFRARRLAGLVKSALLWIENRYSHNPGDSRRHMICVLLLTFCFVADEY